MHFIVLSLPLFPDQWSYCNLSRNFITVSEIEWLRRADTIEKDHHWNTAMPLLFTSPLPSLLCLQLHPNISPFVLTHSPYTQHSTLQTLHYTLTSDITRYWLLSKFITINTMEAMHIARRYSQSNYASNIPHTCIDEYCETILKCTNWTCAQRAHLAGTRNHHYTYIVHCVECTIERRNWVNSAE